MIFKHMSLEEAKEFYEKLKEQARGALVKIVMDDIWLFTDGLKRNYGGVN